MTDNPTPTPAPLTADERAGLRAWLGEHAVPVIRTERALVHALLATVDAVEQRATDAEAAPACGQTYADPRCEAMTRAMREAGDHALDGGCGKPLVWKLAYRCLECGRWMHQDCLRQHFEETRDGACPAERERDEALARVDALTQALILAERESRQPAPYVAVHAAICSVCDQVALDGGGVLEHAPDCPFAALAAGPATDGEPAP